VWGGQVELGDIATEYIPTTTTAVSVGMLADVPRIDYTGGGCGKLLLEPQRTNLALYSEDISNVIYGKTNVTITSNSTTSPDGTANADTITATAASANIQGVVTVTSGLVYTMSVWLKRKTGTGTVQLRGVSNTSTTVEITSEWARYNVTLTASDTYGRYGVLLLTSGDEVYAYGFQLEQSSYATSYVPTLASSVTRLADSASKTGISSLIGQTEGVIYAEIDLNLIGSNAGLYALQVYDSATSPTYTKAAYLEVYQGKVYGYVRNATVQCEIVSGIYADGQRLKMALAYKANDFALYVNGVQIGVDASGSLPSVLNSLSLHYSAASQQGSPLYQAQLYTTRLTNAELATLTTL